MPARSKNEPLGRSLVRYSPRLATSVTGSDREIPGNDHREANSAMEVADVAGADLHRSCARRVGSTRLISRRDDLDRLECGVDREQALDLGRRDVGARQKYQPIQGDQTNNSRLGRDVVVDHFSNPP
jgi:hypothetical protein